MQWVDMMDGLISALLKGEISSLPYYFLYVCEFINYCTTSQDVLKLPQHLYTSYIHVPVYKSMLF